MIITRVLNLKNRFNFKYANCNIFNRPVIMKQEDVITNRELLSASIKRKLVKLACFIDVSMFPTMW
jgi:hypothetical protein